MPDPIDTDVSAATAGGSSGRRDAVIDGVARWRVASRRPSATGARPPVRHEGPGTLASLPRRTALATAAPESTAAPPLKIGQPRASRTRAVARLAVWAAVLLEFGFVVLGDRLRGRNTLERRAGHLRRTLERAGGTFVRIGKALAMRADVVPWVYGAELARLVDRMPPFHLADAVAAIEAAAGRPLADVFEKFDPEPIGSTSTACTYQAVLRDTGDRVVVKVRRPGVGDQVLADLKVCDWLGAALELTTLLRPGSSTRLRRELKDVLLDEVDFVREIRQQDVFRRLAADSGRRFFSAPKVYFPLSSETVIVQEFVAGMWLWELLAAVEQRNDAVLNLARTLDIDPAVVARRLVWVNFWSWHQNLFYLANPHPDNVILGAGGTLTFIDFASTGAMDRTMRRALHQNMHYARLGDPLNMARATLALMEPLPPVDVHELTHELEGHNWQQLYVYAAKPGTRAIDRSSAVQWLGFIQTARKFNITIESSALRLLRATVLIESVAMRLDPTLDLLKQYRRFTGWRARRASDQLHRSLSASELPGVDETLYLRLEQLANTMLGLFFRARHSVTLPRVGFNALMSKGSFVVSTLTGFLAQAAAMALLLAAGLAAIAIWHGTRVAFGDAVSTALRSDLYTLVIVVLVFLNGRALLFRLEDKDA